ncbi:MAG: MBL fold metallo-hydrolase [Pseudomonadota bacterium]
MKITMLGTGSPEAHKSRASSGYLVTVGENRILLDCGGGVFDRLLQAGHQPSDVTHLFFTHLHSDHMMDYARLVHARWDEGGPPLKVWGPPPIRTIDRKLFGREGVFAHDLTARTEHTGSKEVWLARGGTLPRPWPEADVAEIAPGFAFAGDGWRLTSCSVPHAQPQLVHCMAYRIDTPYASFVYSGDAGHSADLEALSSGADLLLHWCYRLDDDVEIHPWITEHCPAPSDIAKMAARAGVQRLLLTHFRVGMDTEARRVGALAEVGRYFKGDASIAEDLEEVLLRQ